MDWSCCTSSAPCADGEGDCDTDSDCMSGFCAHDVGSDYGVSSSFDVCEQIPDCTPSNMDWSCCSASRPCADGDCHYDSDCISGNCAYNNGLNYGATTSFDVCERLDCSPSNMDWGCCSAGSPCMDGDGDCDSDSDCMSGFCMHDVGTQYGVSSSFDVCMQRPAGYCDPSNMDWSCCSSTAPCPNGEGDCDSDSDCMSGYCGHDVGTAYGVSSSFDVCESLTPAPTPAPTRGAMMTCSAIQKLSGMTNQQICAQCAATGYCKDKYKKKTNKCKCKKLKCKKCKKDQTCCANNPLGCTFNTKRNKCQ